MKAATKKAKPVQDDSDQDDVVYKYIPPRRVGKTQLEIPITESSSAIAPTMERQLHVPPVPKAKAPRKNN